MNWRKLGIGAKLGGFLLEVLHALETLLKALT